MAEQIAPQVNRASRQACPFWIDIDQCCSLYKEGLFLPGSGHVRLFCRHENYSSCSHYIKSAQFDKNCSAGKNRVNKRQVTRQPIRLACSLYVPASDGLTRYVDDTALTVDVSEAGLRIESRTPIKVGTKVHFSLRPDRPTSRSIKGSGHIKWCHSLENAPLYHAGIAFAGQSPILDIYTAFLIS